MKRGLEPPSGGADGGRGGDPAGPLPRLWPPAGRAAPERREQSASRQRGNRSPLACTLPLVESQVVLAAPLSPPLMPTLALGDQLLRCRLLFRFEKAASTQKPLARACR